MLFSTRVPRGLVVRIRRSRRRGPGSIPGVGIVYVFFFKFHLRGLAIHQGFVD